MIALDPNPWPTLSRLKHRKSDKSDKASESVDVIGLTMDGDVHSLRIVPGITEHIGELPATAGQSQTTLVVYHVFYDLDGVISGAMYCDCIKLHDAARIGGDIVYFYTFGSTGSTGRPVQVRSHVD